MNVGDKVLYWPNERPLLESSALKAEVLAVSEDGKSVDLAVQNHRTGRQFNVAGCVIAEATAPGVCTVEGVLAHSQHGLETVAPAAAPAQPPTVPENPAPAVELAPGATAVGGTIDVSDGRQVRGAGGRGRKDEPATET